MEGRQEVPDAVMRNMIDQLGELSITGEKYMFFTADGSDYLVRVKNFDSDTDGEFSLVFVMEIDMSSQTLTGRYIILKLKQTTLDTDSPKTNTAPVKDEIADTALFMSDTAEFEEPKKNNQLEVIVESANEFSQNTYNLASLSQKAAMARIGAGDLSTSQHMRKTSFMQGEERIAVETKVTAIVDWVTAEGTPEGSLDTQKALI
mmetsp:Transcript_37568/g.57550  ORF Transcript_37568/g.57550 Transcript_37568/m.57550 type:complete len:204 (-) Transcript_37568:95-706(-)